ncbi:hypothetical protein STEG23_026467 [Scotinomys teguina]
MLERMWSKRNTPPLLVGMQIGTTTLESSIANPQKIGNHSSSRPSHTTLGHISKECPVIQQGHMLNYVHSSIICNSQNLKQPRCPSTEEWIRKMWFIYTMEYYAAEKNNDIMKFAGKWMELENVILSETCSFQGQINSRLRWLQLCVMVVMLCIKFSGWIKSIFLSFLPSTAVILNLWVVTPVGGGSKNQFTEVTYPTFTL